MPSQPGVARKYLAHNFGEYTGGNLTNGHVLGIYISSERSGMCTIQTIQEMFRQRSENCEITLSQVVSLVKRSIDYYRHLKKEEEMTMFSQICEENFPCLRTPVAAAPAIPVPSSELPPEEMTTPVRTSTPTPESPLPSTSQGNISTRSEDMTPRKLKLKRRLKWVLGSSEKLRKKYQRQKKKMKTSTRVVHQTLKRKIAIIERKKTVIHELRSGAANADVVKTTESLKLKEAHRKLLHYHRMNKKTAVPFSVFKKLEEKNKDKDATISDLEHRLLLLGERVEELSGSAPCTSMGLKENLKTYSGNTRMRVFDHIVNKVPTANIPVLLRQNLLRSSAATEERDVPQRN